MAPHPAAHRLRPAVRDIAGAVHPTKVIGISLNTYDLTDAEARRACEAAARETGLPATDPVRFDPAPLVEAVVSARARHEQARSARAGDPRLGPAFRTTTGRRVVSLRPW